MYTSHFSGSRSLRHGLNLIEMAFMLASIVVLGAFGSMLAGATRGASAEKQSAWNLAVLAVAHNNYAMDWEGRQFSLVDDRLGEANGSLFHFHHMFGCHPAMVLGEDNDGMLWGTWLGNFDCDDEFNNGFSMNFIHNRPFNFESSINHYRAGAFRMINVRGFHKYVDGRVYSPTFYAPDSIDGKNAHEFFDDDVEYMPIPLDYDDDGVPTRPFFAYSTYMMSAAAMFDPGVFRRPSEGGWQDPKDEYAKAYRAPAMHQARFADLKTQMVEKDWLRGSPSRFNEGLSGQYPRLKNHWSYNHGVDASPLSLFFDGSVARINAGKATRHDAKVRQQNKGDGLWSRDTPLGNNGYLGDYAYEDRVSTSHTILTTDGILGRDLINR